MLNAQYRPIGAAKILEAIVTVKHTRLLTIAITGDATILSFCLPHL